MRNKMIIIGLIITLGMLLLVPIVFADSYEWVRTKTEDTNASTICSGGEVLFGNGSCGAVGGGGVGFTNDSDITVGTLNLTNLFLSGSLGNDTASVTSADIIYIINNIYSLFAQSSLFASNNTHVYNTTSAGFGFGTSDIYNFFEIKGDGLKIGSALTDQYTAPEYGIFSEGGISVGDDGGAASGVELTLYEATPSDISDIWMGNADTGIGGTNGLRIGIWAGHSDKIWNYENTPIEFGTNNLPRGSITADGMFNWSGTINVSLYSLQNGSNLLDVIDSPKDPSGANNYIQYYDNTNFGSSQRFNYTEQLSGEIYADNTDGGARYVEVDAINSVVNTSSGCMMAWMLCDTEGRGWMTIRDDANNNIAFYRKTGTATDIYFKYKGAGDTDEYLKTGIVDDTWYHLAICWEADVGNDKLTAWVDGVNVGNVSGLTAWNAGPPNSAEILGTSDSGVYLDGYADEAMFFNQSLNHLDIEAIYNAGRSIDIGDLTTNASEKIFAWYTFDGDNVSDYFGRYDGTNVNGITLVDEGATNAKLEHLGDFYPYGDTYKRDDDKDYFGNSGDVSEEFNGTDWVFNAEVGTPNVYWNGFASFFIDTINVSNIINLLSTKLQNATSTYRSDVKFNYTNVTNDLEVGGNFTGNQIYGEMWNYSSHSTPWTFDITEDNVYFNFTNLSIGVCNGFDFVSNDQNNGGSVLITQIAGLYRVGLTMSFTSTDVGGTFGIAIVQDYDVTQNRQCYARREASTDIGNIGLDCLMQLAVGENVSIQVENEDNTRDMVMHTVNLNLVRVGD